MKNHKYALLYLSEIKYDDMAWEFARREFNAEIIDSGVSIFSTDRTDIEKVIDIIKQNNYDVIFTMDFSPAVSDACEKCGIAYISWIFDAPQEGLFEKQVKNNCNYIFSFDKDQVQQTKEQGACNVYHLPMASNVFRNLRLVINPEDEARFSCDISFAGSLYPQSLYQAIMEKASPETQKEIDTVIEGAFGKWDGIDRINNKLTERALDELWLLVKNSLPKNYRVSKDMYFSSSIFSKYLANRERLAIVEALKDYRFKLFTGNTEIDLPGIEVGGRLSYDEELPKLYFLSKINLNITLHSITSGIPMRVFDIMGVGGFMLTNYQPEVEDLFEIGKDIEIYRSIEELKDKAAYYLSHDEARMRIALNGYKKVSKEHNYERRLDFMLDKISQRFS